MHRRMTITLDEVVYEGLYRTVGKRRMSQFIEDLLRPHVVDTSLDDGYRAMATDKARAAEAMEWCNDLAGDPAVGSEIRKTRPAVIVSNNAANRNLARVVVVPLTSNTGRQYPGETVVTV